MGTLRIGNEVVVPLLVDKTDIQSLEVTSNGTYQAPSNSAYNPVNVNVQSTFYFTPVHCDENGIWHYPEDEWSVEYNGVHYDNNIELIPIDTENDEEVIYFLYECQKENSFSSLRMYGGTLKVEWGLSKDGVFTSLGSTTVANAGTFRKRLTDFETKTVIIKITPTGTAHITQAFPLAWASDGVLISAYAANINSILMRYGNMPYGIIASCSVLSIESDNLMNFAKRQSNTNISFASAYTNNFNMKRFRCDGWNFKGNNIIATNSMFNGCRSLCDTPKVADFSNCVSSATTMIDYMFSDCLSWKNTIDASNWDFSGVNGVRGASTVFAGMWSLEGLLGTETWTGGRDIVSFTSMFGNCRNLKNDIDLSGMTFGSGVTTYASMFVNCYLLKRVKLPSIDYTSVDSIATMFQTCLSLEEVECGEPINANPSKITTAANIFANCYSLKRTNMLRGLDLSKAIITTAFMYCIQLLSTDSIDLTGMIPPNISFTSSSGTATPFAYCYCLKKLDLSWYQSILDTTNNSTIFMLSQSYNCVDFYPPSQGFKNVSFSISIAANLNKASLIRILNALPTTSTKLTLTMGSPLLVKLTDDEKAIATGKGWTLA